MSQPTRHRTALIVEDDPTIRTAIVGLLEDEGLDVTTAATVARSSYIRFESRHPMGILVLDLGQPDGDGAELLVRMAKDDAKLIPTIVLSATPRAAATSPNDVECRSFRSRTTYTALRRCARRSERRE